MTNLFWGFPEKFYQAYEERNSIEKGYRDRFAIYNLYHLLNHLNLFGDAYLDPVIQILNRHG